MAKKRLAKRTDSKALARSAPKDRLLKSDGWINPDTGFGTPRDKGASGFFCRRRVLTLIEREELYHFDAVAGRIVDERVNEMFRRMFEVHTSAGPKQEEALIKQAKALNAPALVKEAKRLARLHGGAGIILITKEMGQLADPLPPIDSPAAKTAQVMSLLVLDATEMKATAYYDSSTVVRDRQSFNLIGAPRMFQATTQDGGSYLVHASRVIQFNGVFATRRMVRQTGGWGLSVLERPYEILRAFMQGFQGAGGLLLDMSQAVFKMKGLWDMIVQGKHAEVANRMAAVDKARSSIRAIVIDTEEEFARVVTPLTGVAELLDRYMMLFAASIDTPITKFFGRSAAGMNATGESDARNWEDSVSSEQEQEIEPRLVQLYGRIGAPLGIVADTIEIKFPSLREPTPVEIAQIRKLEIETDHIQIQDGVIDPLEARQHMAGRSYDAIIDADQAAKDLLQINSTSRDEPPVQDPAQDPAQPPALKTPKPPAKPVAA